MSFKQNLQDFFDNGDKMFEITNVLIELSKVWS